MKHGTIAAATVAIVMSLCCTSAFASTISFSDSISLTTTNWSDSVTIPKFDSSLGTLLGVTWELSGHVEGLAKFESLDGAPATVTMNLSAEIELQRPDLTTIVITTPLANTSDNVSAYDTVLDFGGTSGKTYPALSNNSSDSAMSSLAADLALFTGTGSITMPVKATGNSSGAGAGNLITQFSTSASSAVDVTYHYTPVPEPASFVLALLGVGLMGFCGWHRKR